MLPLKKLNSIHSICTSCCHKIFQNNATINQLTSFKLVRRNLLTESYLCNDSWDKYLTSDIMSKVNMNFFITEVDDKLNKSQLVTPLDMDLLATKTVFVDNLEQLEFIENIFEKYRRTQSALFVRESMHHGFVRSYIDLGQADRLLEILASKYQFGIYLDNYTANILMDLYLKEKNYKYAAQVAIEIMLQEFAENQLTHGLSVLSCLQYLKTIDKVKNVELPPEEPPGEDEKIEKILVGFKRNPYFDDHFDIRNLLHLTGKTLHFSSSHLNVESTLLNTTKIYGLVVYGKYLKAIETIQQLAKEEKKFYKFAIDELVDGINELKEKKTEDNQNEELFKAYDEFSKIDISKFVVNEKVDLIKEAEALLQKIESIQVPKDIADQKTLFTKWQKEQDEALKQQKRNFTIEAKRKDILERIDALEKREEILTFFDNKERIKLAYFGKGFMNESPSKIPIPNDEIEFEQLFKRHFKHGKHKRDYNKVKPLSYSKKLQIETLNKIYKKETEDASVSAS